MKKFLISLFVGFIGLISFSNAEINSYYDMVDFRLTRIQDYNFTYGDNSMDGGLFCFNYQKDDAPTPYGTITDGSNNTVDFYGWYNTYCTRDFPVTIHFNDLYDNYFFASYAPALVAGEFPNYTSEQCQLEYSLMPISSCNSEYCEMNNLCSVIGGSGSSTLYINDVRHESAPFIYVNIPEYLQWDYNTGVNEFTINVEGYGYDMDKMQSMVNTQRMTPDGNEMSNLIGVIAYFLPLIAVALLIIRIRRCIKKIFKF